jgi:hypothetical protein
MSIFNDLETELTRQRDARFPPAAISRDGGIDELPLRHKVSAQELIDHIANCLVIARTQVEQAKKSDSGPMRVAPGEIYIDCSKVSVSDALSLTGKMLQISSDYTVCMDFSDAELGGFTFNIAYAADYRSERKAFSIIFVRTIFSQQIFFKSAVTGVLDKQSPVFSNRISIDATEIDARGGLHITGDIGTVVVAKSKVQTLFIYDARILNLNFSATTFEGGVAFQAVTVKNDVSFAGATVRLDARFSECTFTLPPDLHDATFPSETVFSNTLYGLSKKNSRKFKFASGDINKAPGRFRALRVAMKKAGAQHEEADFFAHELRARRGAAMSRDSPFSMSRAEKWISKIYDVVSVYGTSISRSLYFFVGWNALFGLVFFGIDHYCGIENVHLNTKSEQPFGGQPIVLLVLQNAFNPLALFSNNSTAKVVSSAFFLLSMLQSIGSVGIGALVLLAVKVRFQRGSGGGS